MTKEDLKEYINKSGLSRANFAEKLSISIETLNSWEYRGKNIPKTKEKLIQSVFNTYRYGKDELSYVKNEVKEPEAIWVQYEGYKLVPLVNKRAQAGFLSGWGDDEYEDELPKIPWEVDKEYKGKYMTFEVSGDSMESDSNPRESLYEGDLLLCREIQRHHWSNKLHIHKWDFVIVHREDGILAKRIINHKTGNGELTLHSLNPYYDDFKVEMDDLIAIFNIIDVKRSRRR